jgi:hypothetical protein
VREHKVSYSLFTNWDKTGCKMLLGGKMTMEERGSTQGTITGLDDKRLNTVLLEAAENFTLLLP